MKDTTLNLIKQIQELSDRNSIERFVNDTHFEYKKRLKSNGIEFTFPGEDIKPFQSMNKSDYEEYTELNHIRKGISTGWVDTERKQDKHIENTIRNLFNDLDI
jgi:hypothetical protein